MPQREYNIKTTVDVTLFQPCVSDWGLIRKEPREIAADDLLIFSLYLSKKLRLDVTC